MKRNEFTCRITFIILLIIILFNEKASFGQNPGDFRSKATGNWNAASTWEYFNGTSWVDASTSIPNFPVVAGTSTSSYTAGTTSHVINLPSGIQVGDLLLVFWVDANTVNTAPTTPTNWTQLYTSTTNNRNRRCWYKVADGTEGTTINVTAGIERSAHNAYRIAKGSYQGVPVAGTVATANSTQANPPSLTSGFFATNTLWIATAHSAGDGNTIVAPTSYGNIINGYTGTAGDADARMWSARREFNVAAENPGTFGAYSANREWAANTIAIRSAQTPTSSSGVTTVRSPNTVTVTTSVTVDQVIVESGGQVAVNNGNTLTIANGTGTDMEVNGTLQTYSTTNTSGITTTGTLAFNSGGTYIHNVNGEGIPTATWDANSNCDITGVTSTIPTATSFIQTFGNFTWNCTGQTANLTLAGNLRTIKGNFTVSSTGATGTAELRLSSGTIQTLTVDGNFTMTGGTLNFNSSTGTFTMNVAKNFTHSGGTITETSTGNGSVFFNGTYNGTTGMQTYASGGTVSNTINFTVNNGAYLQMAAAGSTVTGGGTFTLANGGTLGITSPEGITTSACGTGATCGNIRTTIRTFNTDADYIYNAAADQNTGNGLPTSVRNLTFSGSGTKTATQGVAVSQDLNINTNTTFAAGTFSHGLQGNWINNGSFTAGTSTVTINGSGAQIIGGSTTTTFNNLIIAKGGSSVVSLALPTATTATGILTMTNGLLDIGNYNLTVGSASGGSSTSYVKTSGTGRLSQRITYPATRAFPVGNSAYNPISITNSTSGNTDVFNIRVTDDPITDSNDNTKTVNRRWYMSKNAAGTATVTVALTYNTGEGATNFNPSVDPKVGYYSGSYWAYENVTVAGTTFTATGIAEEMAVSNGYLAIGSGDSFTATKLAITNINPANPVLGTSANLITVQSQNSQGIPTRVSTATTFDLTALNTTFFATPSGTIDVNTYEKTVGNVKFTETTFNGITYDNDATITVTRTSGENLTSGTSLTFDVLAGDLYEPTTNGNWSTVIWRKTSDGGTTWTNPATLPPGNNFSETELVRIPAGINLIADVTASFYSLGVLGTMEINSSGLLTLNHAVDNNDYNLLVIGTLKNSGGTFNNSNESYPISIYGGIYWHNINGGSIPVATWTTYNSSVSSCIVNGITSTALTAGLNQTFQNFTWNNPAQTVQQNLTADMTVTGNLVLTSGRITTGSYRVIVGLNGTASNSGLGYIDGTLQRFVASSVTTGDFPIGEGNKYTPFSISTTGTPSGNGYIEVSTSTAVPPVASGLNQTNYISRKWTVTNNGVGGVTSYSPSFTFVDADKVGTVTTNLKLRKLTNYIWYPTNGVVAGNTMSASNLSTAGLTAASDFYIGEDNCSASNYVWLGSVNTDWNTAANWCSNQVPTSSVNVTIPGGIIRYPVIGAAGGTCKDITILSGASLTVSGNYLLDVKGNWSDSGTFTAGTGTVSFTGTTAQTITGSTTFNNLTINNSSGVTGGSNFTVNGELALTSANPDATHGTLHMGSNILSMLDAAAIVTGNGDLTGIVRRAHTFTSNISYQFGSQFTTINFLGSGTQPSEISCKIVIGTAPAWKPNIVLRYYSFWRPVETISDRITLNLRYLPSEINGNNDGNLVVWDAHNSGGGTIEEHGKSNNSITDYWVGISGLTATYVIRTTEDNKFWALADRVSGKNTWLGSTSTDWNELSNWSFGNVPLSTEDVLIPDVSSGSNRFPVLTSDVEIKTLEIDAGASLTAATFNLTINGFTGAWQNDGIFDPGTGTLFLTHGVSTEIVTVSGSGTNQFHNIVIGANTFIQPGTGFYMMINGYVSAQLTSVVDLSEINTSVEYNGGNQIIVNPSHFGYKGYYNLIISGTGTKTLFNGTLDLYGNFTNNGTLDLTGSTVSFIGASAQTINGTNVFNNLTINNPNGVSSTSDVTVNGILNLETENPPSLDKGALAMAAGKVLNMGSLSTTTGSGDVTGIIKRTHIFDDNVFYTSGAQYSGFTFSPVASDVKPTSIIFRVTIGTAPDWTGTDWNLYNAGNAMVNPIRRITEVSVEGSPSVTKTLFSIHYNDNEISGGADEDLLTFWSRGYNAGNWYGMEEGESGHNTTDNYITIEDIDCSRLPSTLGDFQSTIAPTSAQGKTWKGLFSIDWNTSSNWFPVGVPTSSDNVIIPSAATTPYSPTLPATATCKTLLIQNGGILNAAGSGGTLTITGANEAWYMSNGGIFNANTSTVVFNGTSGTIKVIGETGFHNFTVSAGALLQPSANSRIGLSGVLTIAGTLDAVTTENIFDFNGTDQNIPNPNGTVNGYHDLIVSGSGTKTFTGITSVNNQLSVGSGVVADLGTFTHSAVSLTIAGEGTASGSWGSTSSTAINTNNTYFAATSGIINILSNTCTAQAEPTGIAASETEICNGLSSTISVTDPGPGFTTDWFTLSCGGTAVSGGTGVNSLTVSPTTTTTYYARTRNTTTGCISSTCESVTVSIIASGTWLGTTSTDWHTASNWCGGVPTSITDVVIPSGGNQPDINAAAVCNNITINTGASLNIAGSNTLTVSGSWTNNGIFTPNSSTVIFNSSGQISVSSGTFNNITFSGTGTKTALGNLVVNGDFTLNSGNFELSNSDTQVRSVTITGNYLQTGGIFDFNVAGNGAATTMNISGNLTNTTSSGSITTSGGGALNGQIVFSGNAPQTITFSDAGAAIWTTFAINSGSYLQLGSNITLTGDSSEPKYYADLSVSGTIDFGNYILNDVPYSGTAASHFSLISGADLLTANPDGISLSGNTGSMRFLGTRTYDAVANYTYNGNTAQNTGDGLPSTVSNLTFDNSGGAVTLNSARMVTNNFSITANTIANLGTFTHSAGSLTLASAGTVPGSWGSTTSGATNKNDNYFAATTGIINISNNSCTALSAPTGIAASPATICDGSSSTISVTDPGAGLTTDWFTVSCGGTAVSGGTDVNTLTVSPATTTTYYARTRNTTTGCVSATCASLTVTVNLLPTANITSNNSPVCSGSDATFTLTGTIGATVTFNINSGSNATVTLTGGTAIVTVSAASSNQTLTLVSVADTNCSQTLTENSTVIVNPLPTTGEIIPD